MFWQYLSKSKNFLLAVLIVLLIVGGFYQDEMGYIGERVYGLGCKQCAIGTYVRPEFSPGKSKTDCQSCPQGMYVLHVRCEGFVQSLFYIFKK